MGIQIYSKPFYFVNGIVLKPAFIYLSIYLSIYLYTRIYSPLFDLDGFLSFLIFCTVGRTPWMG
jgi:hypothetical protein